MSIQDSEEDFKNHRSSDDGEEACNEEETSESKVDPSACTSPSPHSPSGNAPSEEAAPTKDNEFVVQSHHEPEEVAARLFAAPDLQSISAFTDEVGSSVWGFFNSASAKVADKAQELAKEAGVGEFAEKAKLLGEQKGKELLEAGEQKRQELLKIGEQKRQELLKIGEQKRQELLKIGQQKREEILKVIEEFSLEKDPESNRSTLPWDETVVRQNADVIRERILELSNDEKTFLMAPPDTLNFEFDYEDNRNICDELLKMDPKLKKILEELTPKQISREIFWRNYFYRVSLINGAYTMSPHPYFPSNTGSEQGGSEVIEPDGPTKEDTNGSIKQANEDWDSEAEIENETKALGIRANSSNNIESLDDFELLASNGLNLPMANDDDENDDVDTEDLEAKIKAELSLI